jgi:hypothetical protein
MPTTPAPGRDPLPPGFEDSPELEAERARRARRFWAYAQAGGITFLAVVSLGLLPSILSASYPAAGERAAILVWVLVPAIPIALLVVAAFRLPR